MKFWSKAGRRWGKSWRYQDYVLPKDINQQFTEETIPTSASDQDAGWQGKGSICTWYLAPLPHLQLLAGKTVVQKKGH